MTSISARSTGHDGAFLPPHSGRGGDGRGDGNDSPNYVDRLRQARLGLAVAMVPILVLFVSFTAIYLVRQRFASVDASGNAYVRNWVPVELPWAILAVNTGILILSSVTMEFARREARREAALAPVEAIPGVSLGEERRVPWLVVTVLMGLLFLGGQLLVWRDLSAHGFHLTGGTSSSFVYVLTAMHGLHLAGGLMALIFANVARWLHSNVETRQIVVDVTSWYWHAMTAIWVYILMLFCFAG